MTGIVKSRKSNDKILESHVSPLITAMYRQADIEA